MKCVCILFIVLLPIYFVIAQNDSPKEVEVEITDLVFSENWFSDLEEAKKKPLQVYYLDLSLQKHKTFPAVILEFKNLQQLLVPYNYWPSIPTEIASLTKLKKLDMSGNYYMNHLPIKGLSKLKNLEEIIIKDHKLVKGEIEMLRKALPQAKIITE